MYQASYVTVKVHKGSGVQAGDQETGCERSAAAHNPNGGGRSGSPQGTPPHIAPEDPRLVRLTSHEIKPAGQHAAIGGSS